MTTKTATGVRSFFQKITNSGPRMIGGIADKRAERDASSACADGCCNLAYCNTCGVYGSGCEQVNCGSGRHLESWQCPVSGGYWICYECTTGSDCYSGSISCSQARSWASCC